MGRGSAVSPGASPGTSGAASRVSRSSSAPIMPRQRPERPYVSAQPSNSEKRPSREGDLDAPETLKRQAVPLACFRKAGRHDAAGHDDVAAPERLAAAREVLR